MVRLPTSQELVGLMEDCLQRAWDAVDSPEDLGAFFAALQGMIPAPLTLGDQIKIAKAMVQLCARLKSEQDVRQARKLVVGARREIAMLQRVVSAAEKRVASAGGMRRTEIEKEAGRECFTHWEALHRQYLPRFKILAKVDILRVDERLHAPLDALQRAALLVDTPLATADYPGALAALDEVLDNWAENTDSAARQAYKSGAVTDFIRRVEAVLSEATGLADTAFDSGFLSPIVDRALEALPAEFNHYKTGRKWNSPIRKGDSTSRRRVRRARRKPLSPR